MALSGAATESHFTYEEMYLFPSPHDEIEPDRQLIIPIQLYHALGWYRIFLGSITRNRVCRDLYWRGRLVERTIGIPFDAHHTGCLRALHTIGQVDGLV